MNQNNVKTALEYLSGVCDFAETRDGHGFNKPDAFFGHALALTGVATQDEYDAALYMLQKYRGQLSAVGIEIPEIEHDPYMDRTRQGILDATREGRRVAAMDRNGSSASVGLLKGSLAVSFPGRPSEDVLQGIKAIPGRRWMPDEIGKPWTIPLANFANIKHVLPDASWSSDAVDAIANMSQGEGAPAAQPATNDFVSIDYVAGKLAVMFPRDTPSFESNLDKIRNVMNRKWDADKKYWSVPEGQAKELFDVFPDAIFSKEVHDLIAKHSILKEKSNAAASNFKVHGLPYPLMPFQAAGVEFVAMTGGRAMIADQMGLGKTIQALAYLKHDQTARPAVIIVPASLKLNWKRETEKWLPEERVEILSGKKAYDLMLLDATVFIINYDIVSSWADKLLEIRPGIIISDESHMLKNKKSLRSEAVARLAKKVSKMLLLTGTPVTNRPLDLYNLLKMLDPKSWGNFWNYANRYCGAYNDGWGWNFSGATNLEELHEKIKTVVIRRTKDQVLTDLPAKTRVPIALEITRDEMRKYNNALQDRQPPPTTALAEIEILKQAAAEAKMRSAIEWIENFLDTDEKLIVFATHIKIIDQIMDYFGDKAVRVTGNVAMKNRQEAVDRFQNDDGVRLFVGNIQAAGVGLTLTAANTVCFLEYPWTPADLVQAEDRAHRIGQKNNVTSYCLMAAETIDEDVVALLEEKSKIMDTVQDGTATGQTNINILSELVKILKKKGALGKTELPLGEDEIGETID